MTDDIGTWLEEIGLGEHATAFAENGIDRALLPHLTGEDLKELGMSRLGDRKKLFLAIDALNLSQTERSAEQITPGDDRHRQTAAERRQLTVMFCDLVGSTALSRLLDPEDLRDVMRRYQDAVAGAVTRYGGHVAKYLGDGVLVYFGWPQAYEDQAERSVRAGLDAIAAVGEVSVGDENRLAARVGIGTGQVVVGDLVGESGRDTEAVTGETPNLAARLQGLAQPGQVVIGEVTHRLVRASFEFAELGRHKLKGFDEPVAAWRVTTEKAGASRFEAARQADMSRFVGREHELGMLQERWRLVQAGEGQAVLISGDPGIGKSRLVETLARQALAAPAVRLRYQCSPYHTNSPLYPVIQQLERAVDVAGEDGADARLDKLEDLLAASGDADAVALIADLLSLPFQHRYALPQVAAERRKERILAILQESLVNLAANSPVLVVFEDAHWADPTTLDLLTRTMPQVAQSAILMLITHRPEWLPPFGSHHHLAAITLSRLGRSQSEQLARDIAGDALGEELLAEIAARTDGVPLFLEEVTRSVLETDGSAQNVPESLQASLLARLDRLGEAKELAQAGSAIGREFSHSLLAAATGLTADALEPAMERLISSQLVTRRNATGETIYTFKHALVQDAAYETMLRARRQKIHERIGDTLAKEYPGLAEAEPETLAYHYTEAGHVDTSIGYWLKAGEQSLLNSAEREAVSHLSKGLDLVTAMADDEHRWRRELDLLLVLCPALMAIKGYSSVEVEDTCNRAQVLCQRLGDDQSLAAVLEGTALAHHVRGELDASREVAQQVVDLGVRLEDETISAGGHLRYGVVSFFLGEFRESLHHLERAGHASSFDTRAHNVAYRRSIAMEPSIDSLCYLGLTKWSLGYPDQAVQSIEACIHKARRDGGAFEQAYATSGATWLYQRLGDLQRTRNCAERLIEISTDHSFPQREAQGRILRGWTLMEEGEIDLGVQDIAEGVRNLQTIRNQANIPYYLSFIVDGLMKQGNWTKAAEVVAEALSLVERYHDRCWQSELHCQEGLIVLAADGDTASAEACFRRALEVSRRQHAKSLELRAARRIADLLTDRGHADEAREILEPVLSWFTEGFATRDLSESRQFLESIH